MKTLMLMETPERVSASAESVGEFYGFIILFLFLIFFLNKKNKTTIFYIVDSVIFGCTNQIILHRFYL